MKDWEYNATPQPMETCPGGNVLVWNGSRWQRVAGTFVGDISALGTHWLPMPPPPPEPEPVPQRCPVCGGGTREMHTTAGVRIYCDSLDCRLIGPIADGLKVAVEAWNRIRYEK